MPTALRALPIAVLLSACAAHGSRVVTLPLRQVASGQIVVPVAIGDHRELWFVLDTGASGSTITPATRALLALTPDPGGDAIDQAVGASGVREASRRYTIDLLRIGSRTYHELPVWEATLVGAQTEKPPIAGILGQDFLALHDLEIDFPGHAIRLHPIGKAPARGAHAIRFDAPPGGLLRVQVRLDGGVAIPAVIDLGASASIINRAAATSAGFDASKAPMAGAVAGADGVLIPVAAHGFRRLDLGDTGFDSPKLLVADLPVFGELGLAGGPAMILGLDLLGARDVIVDYKDHQLRLR